MKTKKLKYVLKKGNQVSQGICYLHEYDKVKFAIVEHEKGLFIAFEATTGCGFGVGDCDTYEHCIYRSIGIIRERGKFEFERVAQKIPVLNNLEDLK